LRAALCFAAVFCFAARGAPKATVADVSGQSYSVESMRLAKGSKLTVYCGGAKIELPIKVVRNIKIHPKRITSISGKLHFGVELLLRDSTVIGGGGGQCYTPADNGIAGKSSKGKFSIAFEKLGNVYIFGKEDVEKKPPKVKGGEAGQAG